MKPPKFMYCDPDTVEDAVALKSRYGHDSLVLAGGQSLMPMLNMRLANPEVVIDINRVSALQRITRDGDVLEIGAGVRQSELETDPVVGDAVPLLGQVVPYIGHIENRHRGTVGGSLAHADSAAELPCAAVTLDAVVVVQGPAGRREIGARDFFQGWMTNALEPDELVVAVRIPVTPATSGSAFVEVARREGDFALAAAAAVAAVDAEGRFTSLAVGVAGISATPVRASGVENALVGQPATAENIAAAAKEIAAEVSSGDDLHATGAYRKHLAVTVVKRAIGAAVKNAAAAERSGS
ncbi:FAD binding domain-containing protein [Pseudonocardia acidicola]|uniref:Xanthine dehydrogenase family protein subunit M n=1 Tax=Pseudonocardia acidicola TaxID=2724939 RepID=A0ABX1SFH3_9PSEU|nr:FAD binding domain-containing protein [Pseudonocardia acidicola]NMH99647.1 xanthine dehydrogenase family protein subunit M [Pseudonocardia acidicola]